jgi:hypothetical protein
MSLSSEWVSAIASAFGAIGVLLAYSQLRSTRDTAQMQFEDSLAKEYRDLIQKIPTNAMLGEELEGDAFTKTFDELYRYFDLSNEQVGLRRRGRISKAV